MIFGEAVSGVSDSMLYTQRTYAAKAAAPPSGCCGQDLDLTLMMADASANGRADPAFDAHKAHIVTWAFAVWETWLPIPLLEQLMANAIPTLRNARRVWAMVKGPAAAVVATVARIGWQMLNATQVLTYVGHMLDLKLDPPKVVAEHIFNAVERWRWKRVEQKHPYLAVNGSGRGAVMAPI